MPSNEPLILRSATSAAFLASLPHLAGMPLRNSVVVAPFWGNRTPGAIRVDLPDDNLPARNRALASTLLGQLARLDGCDRAAVALYTDTPYAEAFPALRELMDHLLERLHSSGFHIAGAWIVAGDGWGDFFDDEDEDRPLSEIAAAAPDVPAEFAHSAPIALPPTDPALADAVDEQLLTRLVFDEDLDAFGLARRQPLPDPVDFLERALKGDPASAGAQTLAHLIALIDSEGAVDRTVLQLAFGRRVGELSWRNTLSVRERAAAEGCEPWTILLRDQDGNGSGRDAERFGRMLVGDTGVRPSAHRLHAGAALLGRAIAHCRQPERVWVMCALAWVRWAIGLASSADEILRTAALVAPENSLVPVYRTILDRFHPRWVYDRAGEIGGNRAQRRRAMRARGGRGR